MSSELWLIIPPDEPHFRAGCMSRNPSFQQTGVLKMSQRLGDLLVKEKIITPEQLQQASKVQRETSCRLGSALVKLNFLTDEDVTNFLSRQYGVPAINLSYFEIDPSVVKLIPYETA
jgi:type IV pilus assembly protein PilB